MNTQCGSSCYNSCARKVALACFVLALCLGQFGCDREPSFNPPVEQPTHDATGYLIQPERDFLVGGENHSWNSRKPLFLQFEVNGHETKPYILTVGNEMLPHDDWPLAPANKPAKQTSSGFAFSNIEDPPHPIGWVSLNSEEVEMLAEVIKKYFAWSDTAAKEDLHVAGKQMLNLTNQHFAITFSKLGESSNSFLNFYVPFSSQLQGSLPPTSISVTLDKMGVDRLSSVITNLPSRREKFILFRDEQDKIARQRQEAEQTEKARADNLLH